MIPSADPPSGQRNALFNECTVSHCDGGHVQDSYQHPGQIRFVLRSMLRKVVMHKTETRALKRPALLNRRRLVQCALSVQMLCWYHRRLRPCNSHPASYRWAVYYCCSAHARRLFHVYSLTRCLVCSLPVSCVPINPCALVSIVRHALQDTVCLACPYHS